MCRRWMCGLVALLLCVCTVGCASFSSLSPRTQTWLDVFDTVTNVTVYGVGEEAFASGVEKLHDRLQYYHRLFDIYHTYEGIHNLKTVNDRAGEPVTVAAPILDLLAYGLDAYRQTDGQVNILFGAVLEQWHHCRQAAMENPAAAVLPDPAALEAAAAHADPASLVIDRQAGTVCITDPQARLDVGAIAKGYAAELVARYATEELGWTSVLLDVGGNIRTVGGKPAVNGMRPFTIGVKNPDVTAASPYLLTVELEGMAAVTSGDYQRYFEVDGQRYAHIIDTDTLQPAAYIRAVTVIGPDSGQADMLSTALFTMPLEEGTALLHRFPGVEAVWVLSDGSVRYSKGFAAYMN